MINARAFALASLLMISPAFAVSTAKFTLTSAAWTDLGAGPLLLSFAGSGVFAIGDPPGDLVCYGPAAQVMWSGDDDDSCG